MSSYKRDKDKHQDTQEGSLKREKDINDSFDGNAELNKWYALCCCRCGCSGVASTNVSVNCCTG